MKDRCVKGIIRSPIKLKRPQIYMMSVKKISDVKKIREKNQLRMA